jgi:hypothetical protein
MGGVSDSKALHLNKLTKFVELGVLPLRRGMINTYTLISDTNILIGTLSHIISIMSVPFKMVGYGGTTLLTSVLTQHVIYTLQSLNQMLFFL